MQTPAAQPLEERPVADVMTRDLLTLGPDESVLMAWELMCQNQSHHLPVVDDAGHCLGVIDAQTISSTWEASSPQRARRPVHVLLAGRPFIPVAPGDTVRTAAQLMRRQDTDHVAVVDENGLLVGLLTARDLIGALAGLVRGDGRTHPSPPSLYRIEPVLPARAMGHDTAAAGPAAGQAAGQAAGHAAGHAAVRREPADPAERPPVVAAPPTVTEPGATAQGTRSTRAATAGTLPRRSLMPPD